MFIFFVCTGNKAAHFMCLHRNNEYNIAVLEQLSSIVVHRDELHVLKIWMIIFSLWWTDWFDLHMQLGPASLLVHKSKLKRTVRKISKPTVQPAVVNFINSDWLQQSAMTCPLQVG